MRIRNLRQRVLGTAPPNLLHPAQFLIHLGMPRAALVLFDWALSLAPADPIALAGQSEARRLAADADTTRYWRQVVGKPMVKA